MNHANITWITEGVATGGDLSYNIDIAAAQVADLLDQDIDLIIDCRVEANDHDIWDVIDGPEYIWLPTDDAVGHHIPADHFDSAVEAARDVSRVFVHCHMGVNRGPSTALAILLDRGMEPARAFDLIRAKRPIAGLYYAMDAFNAHMARNGVPDDVQARARRGFHQHIRRVMTPSVQGSIQHAIRKGHKKDRREIKAAQR